MRKSFKSAGAAALAAATVVSGLSFGPAAVAATGAPSPKSSSISPSATNGGFNTEGIGFDEPVGLGKTTAVHVGATVNSTIRSMSDTTITVNAPSGLKFAAGTTYLRGQYKPVGEGWSTSNSLSVYGTLDSTGTRFTGRMATPLSGFALHNGYQIRWSLDVEAARTLGTQNFTFSSTGRTDQGTFSFSGTSALTVVTTNRLSARLVSLDRTKREGTVAGEATPGAQIKNGSILVATADRTGAWSGVVAYAAGTESRRIEQFVGSSRIDFQFVSMSVGGESGISPVGVGFPTSIEPGESGTVHGGASVTGAVRSIEDFQLTMEAPSGSSFSAGQRALKVQYKPAGGSWRDSSSLTLTGTLDAARTTFSGALRPGSGFELNTGDQIRWGIEVDAASAANAESLGFWASGAANGARFVFSGTSDVASTGEQTAPLSAEVVSIDHAKKEATLTGQATPGAQIKYGSTVIATASNAGAWGGVVRGLSVGSNSVLVEQFLGSTKVDDKGLTVVINGASNGGFTAAGVGHPATIESGKTGTVHFGASVNDTISSMTGTTVTVNAPEGSTFTAGQTTLTGQYKPAGESWKNSASLTMTGTVNAAGTVFTGTMATPGASFKLHDGHQIRWGISVEAGTTVGTQDLAFSTTGQTDHGNFSVSGKSAVTVEKSAAPVVPVAVTAPQQGSTVETARPVFAGTGDDGATIEVRGSSRVVATTTVKDGNWSVPASFDLADGRYNLRVVQTATNNEVSEKTASFTISTKVSVIPVKVVSPAAGSVIEHSSPTFTGTGHEGATIVIRGSVTELGRTVVKDGKWEMTLGIRLANGDYSFYVDQIPTKGDPSTIRHAITVNNPISAPITVTTPKQGGSSLTVVDTVRPVFQGTATPLAEITIGSSRTTIATTTADAKGNWTATSDRDLDAGGTYRLTATQSKAGKTNTTPVAFIVASKASAISPLVLTAPDQNSTVNTVRPVFEGTATPFAKITVGSSRTIIAEGEADKDGKWTATTTFDLQRGGKYEGLTVRQTTTDERTSTATSSFTVARDAGA